MGDDVALDLVRPDADRGVEAFDDLVREPAVERRLGVGRPEQRRGDEAARSEQRDARGSDAAAAAR